MDARENDRKSDTAEKVESQATETTDQNLDVDYEKLRQKLRDSTQNTLDHLDRLIQASSKKSSKRLYLEFFRALVVDSARSSESLFYLFEYVTDLRASMVLLSIEMEKAKGRTTKDVKQLKSKLDSLINSPAVVEIGKILQNMQRVSEERNKKSEKKPAIGYLR